MSDTPKIPHFRLQNIYADGSRDEPELHALTGIDATCRMGRRGFLLTSAIGAGALAALTFGCDSKPEKSKSSTTRQEPVKKPPLPELKAQYARGFVAHLHGVNTLAFSPDGAILVSGSDDETVKLWSMPDAILLKTLQEQPSRVSTEPLPQGGFATKYPASVHSVAFTPDGKLLLSGSADGMVKFWPNPFDKSSQEQSFEEGGGKLTFLALSPDGKILATSGDSFSVQLRLMPNGKQFATLRSDTKISALAFSPDNTMLASCSTNRAATLWSLPKAERIKEWPDMASSLAFSPDAAMLATTGSISSINFWSMPSAELHHKSTVDTPGLLAFSPDGKYLAVVILFSSILLFRPPFDKPVLKLTHPAGHTRTLTFSPDSKFLAVGFSDGAICLWEIAEDEKNVRFHTALFGPDAIEKHVAARIYTQMDGNRRIVPASEPLPAGAVCTCNSVSGTMQPQSSRPSGGGGCSCNHICTCVPVK